MGKFFISLCCFIAGSGAALAQDVKKVPITVTQYFPDVVEAGDEFTVELSVIKDSVTGFAKVQQDLPDGFSATPVKSNNANFTFQNKVVKFIWMTLPDDNQFRLTYKVKVNENISGTKTIGGTFAYVAGSERKSVEIAPKSIEVKTKALASSGTPATGSQQLATSRQQPQQPAISKRQLTDKLIFPQKTETVAKPSGTTPVSKYAIHSSTGVEFSIQIAASYKKTLDPNYLTKHAISEQIYFEMENDICKFTVGSFSDYRSARVHLDEFKNGRRIEGAFVTAYKNGKRISVSEALMLVR